MAFILLAINQFQLYNFWHYHIIQNYLSLNIVARSIMSFPYKHVLLIGATSGIGRAMADLFLSQEICVTAVGRRQDRLDDFVSKHTTGKATSITFDVANISGIPNFIKNALQQHPTIDAIFLNAGVQSRFFFNNPSSVDLSNFDKEFLVNFTSVVHMTHAILPHLLARDTPTALIYTGSHVSLIPAPPMPAYCASKAALESFMTSVRVQLECTNVSVIHLSPGPVQTEIHHKEMGEARGKGFGMPLEVYTKATWEKMQKGDKNVFVGPVGGSSEEQLAEIVEKREAAIGRMVELIKRMMG
ncbi:unnamed protein product [Periconia digitata]|uniref:NAD(P)-binding protein n=1 Tax=Periconia digitata TaxID=1303443 RepID=A0A9W4XZ31_9PLEO|nr:unnamed protein product [Periconia digitata]